MLNGASDLSPADFNIADVIPQGEIPQLEERIDLECALRIQWRYFEGLAAVLWGKQGFEYSYCTPGTNDHGVDVVAISGNEGVLIQTKTSSKENAILGWETVKEVVAGEAFYCRQHPNVVFKKIGLTNQFFNTQTHEQAALNNVDLIEQPKLNELLNKYSVTMLEVEKMIHTQWGPP